MAVKVNPLKIKPVSYNYLSDPDSSIASGESFNCNKPFLILSGKPIPKDSKVYMEVTVTHHPSNKKIRHIPLYVGVHKEPSFGVLNSDFCIGSVYYTTTSDYDIMERYHAEGHAKHQTVPKLYARIPIVDTVIGIGVDMRRNLISIYSDGKLFYSFSPLDFHINNEPDSFYFAIYSGLYESMTGYINYGRYRTKYTPEGYWDLYQQYYDKEEVIQEFGVTLNVPGFVYTEHTGKSLDSKANIENSIAPIVDGKRDIHLIHKYPSMNYTDNKSFAMESKATNSDITTVNLPCPTNQKVYFEINVKEGTLNNNMQGIPISVGISSRINDISSKSFRIKLFHERYRRYQIVSSVNGVERVYDIPEVTNSTTPTQPDTIGFIFDLQHNQIIVLTDRSIFATVDIKDASYSDMYGISYIFLKSEDTSYTGSLYGICNFGEEVIDYELPDDVMTFYDYYNGHIRYQIEGEPGFECVFRVRPYRTSFSKFIYCNFFVMSQISEEEKKFSPGMNKAWDTYNVVTDTEPHINQPDLTIFNFDKLMNDDIKANNDRRVFINKEFNVIFSTEKQIPPAEFAATFKINKLFINKDISGTCAGIGTNSFSTWIFGTNTFTYVKGTSNIDIVGDAYFTATYTDINVLDGTVFLQGTEVTSDISGDLDINRETYNGDIVNCDLDITKVDSNSDIISGDLVVNQVTSNNNIDGSVIINRLQVDTQLNGTITYSRVDTINDIPGSVTYSSSNTTVDITGSLTLEDPAQSLPGEVLYLGGCDPRDQIIPEDPNKIAGKMTDHRSFNFNLLESGVSASDFASQEDYNSLDYMNSTFYYTAAYTGSPFTFEGSSSYEYLASTIRSDASSRISYEITGGDLYTPTFVIDNICMSFWIKVEDPSKSYYTNFISYWNTWQPEGSVQYETVKTEFYLKNDGAGKHFIDIIHGSDDGTRQFMTVEINIAEWTHIFYIHDLNKPSDSPYTRAIYVNGDLILKTPINVTGQTYVSQTKKNLVTDSSGFVYINKFEYGAKPVNGQATDQGTLMLFDMALFSLYKDDANTIGLLKYPKKIKIPTDKIRNIVKHRPPS